MSTISAIFEPESDGSLRLPLPPELHHVKVRVEAKLEAAEMPDRSLQFECMAGKITLAPAFNKPVEDFTEYTGSD